MTSTSFSAFHRICQDEIWHFYSGSPLYLHCIGEDGVLQTHMMGNRLLDGQCPQVVVLGGSWFAAEVLEGSSYALVGCTVSPGFSYADFELANQKVLVADFPQHEQLIMRLTR